MDIKQVNLQVSFENDDAFYDVYDTVNDDGTITVINSDDEEIKVDQNHIVEITEFHVIACNNYYQLLQLLKCKKAHISCSGDDAALIHSYSNDSYDVVECLDDTESLDDIENAITGYGFAIKKKTKLKELSTVLKYFKD